MDIEHERVLIEVGGESLVGILRRPANEKPAPTKGLVFLGPLTSVKEQVPGNYAKAMAARGFATLAIDNRHFGESGGEPRQFEHPARKVEDIRAAAQQLLAFGCTRIGAVGVCAGAGYMAAAVASDPDIRAFATVAGFFHDADQQRNWMGDSFDAALERARKAREDYERSGVCAYIPAVGKDGDVAMPLAEAFTYYGTERGAAPNYENKFAVMSREHTLLWDAQRQAPRINVPTLMIHSERALAPALARKFFGALGGPKEELWLESQGQIDFYDDPRMIQPVADSLAAHFDKTLAL